MDRFARLLTVVAGVLGTALVIACAEDTTAPGTLAFGEGTSVTSLTRCEPQPYAKNSAWIGPKGGALKAGKNEIKIPAGALAQLTFITMVAPSDTLNYVVFTPKGLTFNPKYQPTLVMNYKNCPDASKEFVRIVYVDDSLSTILETTQPVATEPASKTVGAKLKHFSRYAVAY